VDGPILLAEALASGVEVDSVCAEAALLDDPAVRAAAAAGAVLHEVAEGALSKVLDLRSPQGVVAVVPSAPIQLDAVLEQAVRSRRPVLAAVALQDPGNFGTLVRVAEAAGCAGVVSTPGSVDLHNPKTVRATAGAVFRVPVAEQVDPDELLQRCESLGVTTWATVGREGRALETVPLAGAAVVLVGAEAHGLPEQLLARCTGALTIPMEGALESLNAAVAGSVVMFEAARQRRAADASAATDWRPPAVDGTQ
jgi:TrmH family RNA methyltransferase